MFSSSRVSFRSRAAISLWEQAAVSEPEHAVRDAEGHLLVVRYHDHRRAKLDVDLANQFHDFRRGSSIEIACRLVGQKEPRAMDDRPCDRHPLLFAAAELGRAVPGSLAEADAFQRLFCKPSSLAAVNALECQRESNVFQGSQARDQVIGLKDESDVRSAIECPLVSVQSGKFSLLDPNGPF